jgi:hypothetical protein
MLGIANMGAKVEATTTRAVVIGGFADTALARGR